jgi:hypothetical protein
MQEWPFLVSLIVIVPLPVLAILVPVVLVLMILVLRIAGCRGARRATVVDVPFDGVWCGRMRPARAVEAAEHAVLIITRIRPNGRNQITYALIR